MRKYEPCAFKNRLRKISLAPTALAGVLVMFMQTLKIQTIYQYLSAKLGRQFLTRAGNVLDLSARRAGIVLHFVSIAVYSTYCCACMRVNVCLLYGYLYMCMSTCTCTHLVCSPDGVSSEVTYELGAVPRLVDQIGVGGRRRQRHVI